MQVDAPDGRFGLFCSACGIGTVTSEPYVPPSDQAEMFAKGQMKRVAFAPADVDAQTVKRYNPGVEP